MSLFFNIVLLVFLFAVLGISAGFVVKNAKYLASVLKIRLFAFGILLGLITSLPELSLGINSSLNKISDLSVGNLLGGIIVIFCLILGVSLLLNRQIETDGKIKSLIPAVLVIFSPLLLGIDGKYQLWDGLIMIFLYMGLIFYLYYINHYQKSYYKKGEIKKNEATKSLFFVIIGMIVVLLASHWIIKTTLTLSNSLNINNLVIGMVIFSIGTNLPEITIAITSWIKKTSELSLSHLLSSAFTNILILGILATINPVFLVVDINYWIMFIFVGITLILFSIFYHSNKKMDQIEGLILLSVYILFLISKFLI